MKKVLFWIPTVLLLIIVLFAVIYFAGRNEELPPFIGDVATEVKKVRKENNLGLLQPDKQLDDIAIAKCQDMVGQRYYDHKNPQGYYVWQLYRYDYKTTGENLATGYNATDVIQRWLASPEHKKNIVNPAFNKVGYAVCKDVQYYYVVQILKD